MSQSKESIRKEKTYTRADFAALRGFLQRLDAPTIMRLYYNEDDLDLLGINGPRGIQSYMEAMRDDLAERLVDINPNLSEIIQRARKQGLWTPKLVQYLVDAGESVRAKPQIADPVSAWVKVNVSHQLKRDDIHTLQDLMQTMAIRGRYWYMPVPGLGRFKAKNIQNWIATHQSTLGPLPESLFVEEPTTDLVVIDSNTHQLVPFERMSLAPHLDGSVGLLRSPNRCLISANNDYLASLAFLKRYDNRPKTRRAYQKEIERFILWCIMERGIPMSSTMLEDCTAFLSFATNPPDTWCGPRRPKSSRDWKPFSGSRSAESIRYTCVVLRSFFDFLKDMNYLAGNPWVAAEPPPVETGLNAMQIDKALTSTLWEKLTCSDGILDQLCSMSTEELGLRYGKHVYSDETQRQCRVLRAAVLLLGNTGMRREELATALRSELRATTDSGVWSLRILGKRMKRRLVYLSEREMDALREHWRDRGENFDAPEKGAFLLSPVIIPLTSRSKKKHFGEEENSDSIGKGFTPDGIYKLVTTWFKRISVDTKFDLTLDECSALLETGVHALRHTFGTLSVADEMPLDVIQHLLGHKSLDTTSIYLKTPDQRAQAHVAKRQLRKSSKADSFSIATDPEDQVKVA